MVRKKQKLCGPVDNTCVQKIADYDLTHCEIHLSASVDTFQNFESRTKRAVTKTTLYVALKLKMKHISNYTLQARVKQQLRLVFINHVIEVYFSQCIFMTPCLYLMI